METENQRIRIAKKIYSPPKETPRKKKQNKKDLDGKNPEAGLDISEQKPAEPEPCANPQLVQHIFKLQHDLIETKKKIKSEQIKFKNLITSVSSYFEKDGKEFLKTLDGGNLFQDKEDSAEQESGFEKFFTTHKYLISEKKIEPVQEEEHNNEQKPKPKASKPKASSGVIKISLKDIESEKPEAQAEKDKDKEKEPMKKSKKKKASSPVEEEKEATKKKRVKKNTPAPGEEGAVNKGSDMSKAIVISPTEKETGHEGDKVKKAEEAINKYEELTHMKPGPEAYGSMMQNNMFNEGIKYMMQQAKVDPSSLLNQQLMMGNMGYNPMMQSGEPIDQAKLVQELIKQGIQDPVLMGMGAPTQELLNYYQRAFQS